MRKLLALLLIAASFAAQAQTDIKAEDAKNHVGDSVHILSKVYGVKHFPDAKEPVTLINIGATFPNQLITAVIKNDVRSKMSPEPTETNLIGKEVHLTGKIELYKGKPQIVIIIPAQFQVVGEK